jgi:hypothetical protein
MGRDRSYLLDIGMPASTLFAGLIFVSASDVSGLAKVLVLLGFASMLGIWFTFRALRTYATLSRLAAIGEPEELIEVADRNIGRARRLWWLGRSPAPYQVQRAIGLTMAGRFADAEAEITLATERLRRGGRTAPVWQLLADTTLLTCRVFTSDASGARTLYDTRIAPRLRQLPGAGRDLTQREQEAQLAFAEAQWPRCIELSDKLAGDNRLAHAPRAFYQYLSGVARLQSGDRAAAEPFLRKAASLAPKTHVAAEARRILAAA